MLDNVIIVWATDDVAPLIVDHCQYCRSKKLRINLLFKKVVYG